MQLTTDVRVLAVLVGAFVVGEGVLSCAFVDMEGGIGQSRVRSIRWGRRRV